MGQTTPSSTGFEVPPDQRLTTELPDGDAAHLQADQTTGKQLAAAGTEVVVPMPGVERNAPSETGDIRKGLWSTVEASTVGQALGMGARMGADACLPVEATRQLRQRALTANQAAGDIAEELSAALALAERIRARNVFVENAADRLNFVFDCVLSETPKLVLAQDERLRLQVEVYQRSGIISRILARISAGSPVALVIAALGASMLLWSVGFALARWFAKSDLTAASQWILFMDGQQLSVITSAAFVGGVISIGTRLKEFSRVRDLDPFAMFWTAMLKPLIGVILAVVVLTALVGGVIGFDGMGLTAETLKPGIEPSSKVLYVLWLVGFITGFSERFAWDFVDRAQGSFGVGKPPPAPGRGAAATG